MPAGNKMHLSDPRRELLHGTEPIRHQPPVAEAVLAVAVVKSHALIFRLFRPPFRVVSVHPENNKIYVHDPQCFPVFPISHGQNLLIAKISAASTAAIRTNTQAIHRISDLAGTV